MKEKIILVISSLLLLGLFVYTVSIVIPYHPKSQDLDGEAVVLKAPDINSEFRLDLYTIYTKNGVEEGPLLLAFNENFSSWAYDESSNENHGRIRGPNWTRGRFGSGLLFDGIDDYIEVEHSCCLDITGGITLMAWVKPNTTEAPSMTIIEKINDLWGLYLNGNRAMLLVSTLEQDCIIEESEYVFETGEWYLLTGVYDGNEMRLYVNGDIDSSTSPGDCFSDIDTSPHPVMIGGHAINNGYFNGTIDEVAVYNRSFSAEEISGLYMKMADAGA